MSEVLLGAVSYERGTQANPQPLNQVSLEHVMPERPAEKSRWAEDWPDEAKREEVLHKLGNLAIVNVKMSSKLGNGGFIKKRGAFHMAPYPLTREIATYASWKEKDVRRAQTRLVALAKKRFLRVAEFR